MMDRKTIKAAAKAMEGTAALLPPCWDFALVGYVPLLRMPDRARVAVAIYDYDIALEGIPPFKGGMKYDPEDHLLDDSREVLHRLGIEPLVIHTRSGR